MKKYFIPFVAVILMMGISCKKECNTPPPPPPVSLDDARSVLLKDVIAERLPSPYFHFTYDNKKYVTQINFASGFSIYNVEYEKKRVKKMTNINNNNSILYSYSNDQVSEINEFSGSTGNKNFSYRFSYNTNNQLIQVRWFDFSTNSNGDLYKTSELTYQMDGNLATIDHLHGVSPGQLGLSKRDVFSDYDTKTNVDDFYLLEDFFDTFLFLPQVKFQKNNPQKQRITGVDTDYDIVYTYEYQNNLPVKRTGIVTKTRGSGTGEPIQIFNHYNYY